MKNPSGFEWHMPQNTPADLEPRKTPVQARSTATMDAIYKATSQVLLSEGSERLTTTRVAERAGAPSGPCMITVRQAVAACCLKDHMNKVAEAVEAACERARGKPLAEMVQDVVEDSSMQNRAPDISTALYRIATDVDGTALVRRAARRSRKALEATPEDGTRRCVQAREIRGPDVVCRDGGNDEIRARGRSFTGDGPEPAR